MRVAWQRSTRGVEYYLTNLFDEDGLPKPFSKAPRLTVYKRELYDCAECINLCLLLRDRFPATGSNLGESRRSHFGCMGQARRIVPLSETTPGLGQRSHASLGTVADVSKLSHSICARLLKRQKSEWQSSQKSAGMRPGQGMSAVRRS